MGPGVKNGLVGIAVMESGQVGLVIEICWAQPDKGLTPIEIDRRIVAST